MKPTVYIETTIPSLLTAWPNRDVEIAAQQIATREWWQQRRQAFDLYGSQEVLKEAARGDADAARDRLAALAECRILAATDMAESGTERILSTGLIPAPAASDAVPIGYAAAHGMDFLLTWNCRHILNAVIQRRLAGVRVRGAGFQCPQRVQEEANPADLTFYRVEEVWSPFSYAKRVVDC